MANVAMMQPTFMPWMGYFELIYNSDIFIFLDNFQFSIQSWHQRNRLFVNRDQVDWYTIPVNKTDSFLAQLDQTVINASIPWRKKMVKRIEHNYSKADYFDEVFPLVEGWLKTEMETLAEQNMLLILNLCAMLGIDRKFRKSSGISLSGVRSYRVLELLRLCNADHYYCAKGAFGYMLEDAVFPVDGIEVLFQDFMHIPYKQIGSSDRFIPSLSIIDALMNVGPEMTHEMISHGTAKWLTWDDMKSL
jgi:hypothetical protein